MSATQVRNVDGGRINTAGVPSVQLAAGGRGRGNNRSDALAAQIQQVADDSNSLEPSQFAKQSSLNVREVPKGSYKTTCWFEPLGYCQDGMNRNCWCSWHLRHLFNGQSTSEYVTVYNQEHIEMIKYNRMLTYIPMPFRPSWVRVFPLIELFPNLAALENSLNFGMMQYTLKQSSERISDEEISQIVTAHKAYFLMMVEAATHHGDFSVRQNREIPPVVRLNTAACIECMSNHLLDQSYDIHLMVSTPNSPTPLHMNLRKCTAFTQSIVLLFDIPYGFPSEMNVCLAIPPAYVTHDRYLVADQSKLHCGTYRLESGVKTYGSQCTLMMFRLDGGGEVSFFDANFKVTKERCVVPMVSKTGLFDYLYPQARALPPVQPQQQ